MRPNPTAVLVAAVVAFLGLLGVVLALDLAGHPDDVPGILALGGPIVAALFVAAKVDAVTLGQNARLDQHSQQLATITKQTNGVLDQRIRDGVTAVLAATGVIPPQQPTPPAAPVAAAPPVAPAV